MKRVITGALALLLLLCGCSDKSESGTTPTTQSPTEPAGFYNPASGMEQASNGGVREYALPDADYLGVYPMGQSMLLVREEGELIAISGENGYVSANLEIPAAQENPCVKVFDQGASYYDAQANQLILLNTKLNRVAEIKLPEDMQGLPVYSPDSKEIYFLQGQDIRALGVETGINRLVLSHRYSQLHLADAHIGGTVLAAQQAGEDGQQSTIYIQVATGQILQHHNQPDTVQSRGKQYMVQLTEGGDPWYVFSEEGKPLRRLKVESAPYGLLAMNGAVECAQDGEKTSLNFYNLLSGKRTSAVSLPADTQVVDIAENGAYIWVLVKSQNKMRLYRWDGEKTPVADENTYVHTVYTAQNPDTQGIEACRERAEQLSQQYGLEILLWDQADLQNETYEAVGEYQVENIQKILDTLQMLLPKFPEGFFDKTVAGGDVRLSVVRSIVENATCAQYYQNGDACILLTAAADVETDFLRCVALAADSHVLGNSRDYDSWSQLNPKGFSYLYEDPDQTEKQLKPYLQGKKRHFICWDAVADPRADRCWMFVYAMKPNMAEAFAPAPMQTKLGRLCEGIREAYGWEKSEETFPWEQYLTIEMNLRKK